MKKVSVIYGDKVNTDHILAAHSLDKIVYPEKYHLPVETCIEYHNANSNIYTMLLVDNKVVGYINFCPIDELTYYKLRSGKYLDLCINPENILPYQDNKMYYAYFSSIVVEPKCQKRGHAKRLLHSLISQLVKLADRGIYFKRIIADVISSGGAALMNNLGLSKMKSSKNDSDIYEAVLIPNKLKNTEHNSVFFQKYNSINHEIKALSNRKILNKTK